VGRGRQRGGGDRGVGSTVGREQTAGAAAGVTERVSVRVRATARVTGSTLVRDSY